MRLQIILNNIYEMMYGKSVIVYLIREYVFEPT